MKKTLAILLALIMTASVALTSCDNSADNIEDDEDFVIDDFGGDENKDDASVETNEKGETVKPNTDKNTTNTNGSNTSMENVNDKVYVLYDANIRDQASTKNASKVIGKAPFGAELTRTQKNSSWSKVTYKDAEGKTIEGYISNELVTTNKQTVTFVKQEKVTGEGEDKKTEAVVSKLVGTDNYRLRYFPLADGYPNKVTLELGELGQVKGGTEVTVLEVSEDNMWAKIQVKAGDLNLKDAQGNYATDSQSPVYSKDAAVGYVLYKFLEIGASNNNNQSGGNNTPSAG